MLSGVPSFADIASGRRVKPHSESQSPMIPRIKVESGSMVTMCRSSGIQTRCRKVRKGNGQFGRSLRINMSETTAMAKNAPSEIHASESEESNKKVSNDIPKSASFAQASKNVFELIDSAAQVKLSCSNTGKATTEAASSFATSIQITPLKVLQSQTSVSTGPQQNTVHTKLACEITCAVVETGTTNENVLTPSVAALFARGCIKLNPRAAEFVTSALVAKHESKSNVSTHEAITPSVAAFFARGSSKLNPRAAEFVPSAVTSKLESKSNVSTKESLTPSVAAFFARGSIKLNPLAAAFVPRVVVSPEETNNVEKVSIHVECGPHTPGSSPVECEKATGNVVENRASKLVKYGQYHLDPRLSVPPYLAAPLISYVNLGLPSPAPFYLMGADDRPVLAAMALPWFSKDPKTGEDVLMMPPGPEVVCGPPVHSESGFAPVYRAPSSVTITFTFGLPNLGRGNAFFLPADRHLCTARPIPNGVKAWQKAV